MSTPTRRLRRPWGEDCWIHVPTGWIVDPKAGHVYGVRQGSVGRRLGSPNRHGVCRINRRATDGTVTVYWVRQVVWEVVHDTPVPEDMVLAHLDGDPTNCAIDNLVLRPRGKLTRVQAESIRDAPVYESATTVAARVGVSISQVYRIRSGNRWKD